VVQSVITTAVVSVALQAPSILAVAIADAPRPSLPSVAEGPMVQ
jgi:hypothetical protein